MPVSRLEFSDGAAMVAHLLDGTFDAFPRRKPRNIPFTKDPQAREAATFTFVIIVNFCCKSLTPHDLVPLCAKLLTHFSRSGRQSQKSILAFRTTALIRAIKHAPHLVARDGTGIPAIIRNHNQHLDRQYAAAARMFPRKTPPRAVLWSSGSYTLEETTDPRHLVEDGNALNHCIGTATDIRLFDPHNPHNLHNLTYWLKIKRRQARIITLMHDGQPRVTIHYDIAKRNIIELSGRVLENHAQEPISAAERNALRALPGVVPLHPDTAALLQLGVMPLPASRRFTLEGTG